MRTRALLLVASLAFPRAGWSADVGSALKAHRDQFHREAARTRLPGSVAQGLSRLMSVPPVVDAEGLNSLARLGEWAGGYENRTGFIELPAVVDVLAAALGEEKEDVRRQAFRELAGPAKPSDLARNAPGIKEALARHPFAEAPRLLALLPLDGKEKASLLERMDLPTEVRARLGDAGAEKELLERFGQASDYRDLREAAAALGYAATPSAARALLRRLGSDVVLKAPYEVVSIRHDLIEALGRIHPEELLLTRRRLQIHQAGDERYGLDSVRAYLDEVAEWGRKTYGAVPERTPRGDVLLRRKIVVIKPLRNQ